MRKKALLISSLLILVGCSSSELEFEAETEERSTRYVVPSSPENSDHGYLLEDNRIPTIYSCEEWTEFWDSLGPAVSFRVAEPYSEFDIAVSTEIFLKNKHLDSDGDGIICLLEHTGLTQNEPETDTPPANVFAQEPISVLTPVEELSNLEECKIPHGERGGSQTTRAGFPAHPDYELQIGDTIVVQLLFVEAEDMPANEPPDSDQEFFLRAEGFLEDVTERKVDFEIRFPNEIGKLPFEIIEYGLTRSGEVRLFEFVQDSIAASDSFVDFTDVDIVVVVPPSNVSAMQVAFSPALPLDKESAFETQEGAVYRGTLVGQDMRWDEGHLLLAHEIGHLLGLQDYYSFAWQEEDAYEDQFKFLGEFDNMNSAAGKAREWTGWSRFLLGMLGSDQVRCVTNQMDTIHKLVAIGDSGIGPKITIIPTGPHSAVVVESRKPLRHDARLPDYLSGLLVYRVDTERDNGFGPLEIVRKDSLRSPFLLDAPLRVGESVEVDGLLIRNVESSPNWDVVRVTKN